MYISVTQGTIQRNENANPVKTLRTRYDAWRKTQPPSFRRRSFHVRRSDGERLVVKVLLVFPG
jgi:hypothetical protein